MLKVIAISTVFVLYAGNLFALIRNVKRTGVNSSSYVKETAKKVRLCYTEPISNVYTIQK